MKSIPVKLSGGRGYDISVGLPLKSVGANCAAMVSARGRL